MKKLHREKLVYISLLFLILPFLAGAGSLVDPTKPPGAIINATNPASNQQPRLTAIFTYPQYKVAIIDEQIVQIGDKLGELTVISITPDTVELAGSENDKETLELVTSHIKSAAPKGI